MEGKSRFKLTVIVSLISVFILSSGFFLMWKYASAFNFDGIFATIKSNETATAVPTHIVQVSSVIASSPSPISTPRISPSPKSIQAPTTTLKVKNTATTPKPKTTISLEEFYPTEQTDNEVEPTPTPCPTISDKYATIIELRDSLGNVYTQSSYNQCTPEGGYYSVKKGDVITITVNVSNIQSNPILYEFVGNGFPNEWQSGNTASVKIDGKDETVHLRVFVKNSDDVYRAPDYDDLIQVFYKLTD